MFLEHSFTDARSHLTAVVDKVISNQPQIIRKRKQSEKNVMLIDTETQKELLTGFSFMLGEIPEEDGSITLALDVLNLYANGITKEEATNDLLEQLQVYAEEYSDVDLLVLTNKEKTRNDREKLSDIAADINIDYGVALSCLYFNLSEWELGDNVNPFLKDNVEKEGIVINVS